MGKDGCETQLKRPFSGRGGRAWHGRVLRLAVRQAAERPFDEAVHGHGERQGADAEHEQMGAETEDGELHGVLKTSLGDEIII